MSQDTELRLDNSPSQIDQSSGISFHPVRGAMYGIGAFVVGYLATTAVYLLHLYLDGFSVSEVLSATQIEHEFAIVFYNSHLVEAVLMAGGDQIESSITFIRGFGQAIELTFFLLPAAILYESGNRLVKGLSDSPSGLEAGVAGANTAVGYVPVFVAGTFLVSLAVPEGTITVAFNSWTVAAGVAFPVICGGLGGIVAGHLNR